VRRTDPLIVGGGPAGAAVGIALARGGARPTLFDRNREPPDMLCGGFISWQTLESLGQLGVSSEALGGPAIDQVALYAGDRCVRARLPKAGMGLSRRRLDNLLLSAAEQQGTIVRRGETVREITNSGTVLFSGGESVQGTAVFLATGKHDVRGLKRPVQEGDAWMGLRYRLPTSQRLQPALANTIELHFFRHGYAGLLLQEDGSANLCIALRKSRLTDAGGDPLALLGLLAAEAPALGEHLAQEPAPTSSDAIAQLPYGWRQQSGRPGLFRLGDQAAVIPSLAGEGMGIALASSALAARAYLAGGAAAAVGFQQDFAQRARRPLAIATSLKRIADHPQLARRLLGAGRIPGLISLLARLTRISG
jgi:flavin-dependent dehydrogenase